MALWKVRSPSPEQKVQIVEGESEEKTFQAEDSGSFLGIEDAKMSEVFSSTVPVPINSLMELFEGNSLERRVMGKIGCVDYSVTPWEVVKPDVWQRKIHYKFDQTISGYGKEVTGTQQKFPLVDSRGWVIEEVMTLQGVLLCDHFSLRIRYCMEDPSRKSKACSVQVSLGIAWLKSTNLQKRITKNVISYSSHRFKEIFHHLEKEFSTGK